MIRFKTPLSGTTVVEDVIKGNIVFQNDELDDFVICRSDGTPTYNFVVVVDDITMNINTIIRGDDHVMNTPKQILLYRALQAPLPTFGHVPMVLGSDRSRLSKRHGAMSVTAYRDMGFLPDAVVNYLVRLGWSHGDQEFFTRDELIRVFDLKSIGRSAGIFDLDKLLALNAEHIKATSPANLVAPLTPFLKDCGIEIKDDDYSHDVIETLIPRSKTLEVTDLRVDEKNYTSNEQKMAILRGDTLSEGIKGTMRMRDKDGSVMDDLLGMLDRFVGCLPDAHRSTARMSGGVSSDLHFGRDQLHVSEIDCEAGKNQY